MGDKQTIDRKQYSESWEHDLHLDGSTTDVFNYRYGTTVVHHDASGNESSKNYVNWVNVMADSGEIAVGCLLLAPLVFAIIGLFALRNSTYTMMAAPVIVYQLAMGQGLGWIALAAFVVPSVICAIVARYTEQAGVIMSFIWSLLMGVLLIVWQVVMEENRLFIIDWIHGGNWIDVIGLYIGTVIHCFFFTMSLQCITILISWNDEYPHVGLYWITMPIIFILLNFLSAVFNACGSDYPMSSWRYYEMIQPICLALGLTEETMTPALEWLSRWTHDMPLYCLIAAVVVVLFCLLQDPLNDLLRKIRRRRKARKRP